MFKSQIYLTTIAGTPIFLDMSLIFLGLIMIMDFGNFLLGITCAIMLLISITAHEFGHILSARLFGYNAERVTLSLLGGCASFINLPRKAWQEFVTALAGPLVSFVMAGAMLGILSIIPSGRQFNLIYHCIYYTFIINLILGAFNLLPGFPLDGGRIFRSFMRLFVNRTRATFAAMCVGRVFAILLGLWGVFSIFSNEPWGFIRILIAWMIWREGMREYKLAQAEDRFDSFRNLHASVSPPPYEKGKNKDVDIFKS